MILYLCHISRPPFHYGCRQVYFFRAHISSARPERFMSTMIPWHCAFYILSSYFHYCLLHLNYHLYFQFSQTFTLIATADATVLRAIPSPFRPMLPSAAASFPTRRLRRFIIPDDTALHFALRLMPLTSFAISVNTSAFATRFCYAGASISTTFSIAKHTVFAAYLLLPLVSRHQQLDEILVIGSKSPAFIYHDDYRWYSLLRYRYFHFYYPCSHILKFRRANSTIPGGSSSFW